MSEVTPVTAPARDRQATNALLEAILAPLIDPVLDELEASDAWVDVAPEGDVDSAEEPDAVPANADALLASTARHLDWPTLMEALSSRCVTRAAAQLARVHPLVDDPELIRLRTAQIGEIVALLDDDDRPEITRLEDIRGPVLMAGRGRILGTGTLRRVHRGISALNAARRFFRTRQDDAPLCWDAAEPMIELDGLERALDHVFDRDGEIADDASPELRQLRRRVRRIHDALRKAIEKRVHDRDVERLLQDSYYTMREGRYVLPVRVQDRSRVDGIVHATSSSGQTVFVEPSDLVELNNKLRIADFDVQAEIQRILRRYSEQIADHADALVESVRRFVYLDLLLGCARLAVELDANPAQLVDRGADLRLARHPILVLRHRERIAQCENADEARRIELEEHVVPNDIVLDPDSPALVVSGANAGGKTVTLKTLGLCALMVRLGLPVPTKPGSRLPLFGTIVTDIGDEQSITKDTSTFSAHVLNLRRMLPRLDAHALVLLDEPFSGTDPAHAAALTIALLEHLHEAQSTFVATTHLDRVKAYALEHDWLASASVDFDVEEMRPTYKLHLGVPGGSSALRIAERMDLEPSIVARARALRSDDPTGDLDEVLNRLEQERRSLELQKIELERAERDVRREARRLRKERDRVRKEQIHALSADARKLQREVRTARSELERMRSALADAAREEQSTAGRESALRDAESTLEQAGSVARRAQHKARDEEEPERPPIDEDSIVPGATVYSQSYRKRGTVEAVDDRGVTLQIGAFRVTVPPSDLARLDGGESKGNKARSSGSGGKSKPRGGRRSGGRDRASKPAPAAPSSGVRPTVPQGPDNTLDLRGLRRDEAAERVEMYLDSMLRKDLPNAYVIHGHGSGVLKRTVRELAARSDVVTDWRPGERHEGGDGVTVLWVV